MAFKDIIGQSNAINILKGVIAKDRVPHAMLFKGEEGIGKKLTAINFAKALNCIPPHTPLIKVGASEPVIDSCDQCPSCVRIDKGIHTDVTIIGNEEESGQIKIGSIRRIQESLSFKPFEGRWKVVIIDNAETLNTSAANAFLETLEQPSSMSLLILITSRPEMILKTIRSRCQNIIFSPLPILKMGELLSKRSKVTDEDELLLISALSGGRLGYALNEDLVKQRDGLFGKFLMMLDNPEKEIWADRDEMQEWFDWCQLWLRDIAVFNATGRKDLLINKDKADEIAKLSKKALLKDIIKLSHKLDEIKGLLNFNLNIPITVYHTSMLIKKTLGRMNA
ncbi:MAG: DNA polymerase III subunit [Thermodesulfovibrionia bacterium]|nr:DNA polymerase III subunit [Thermodesulfovibrionia bacterium]